MAFRRLSLLVCLSSAGAVSAYAQQGREGMHRHRFQALEQAASELDLSDTQRAKMKAVHDEMEPRINRLRAGVHVARERLDEAMRDESATAASLTKLHEAVLLGKTELRRAVFERMLSIRGILNKDQLKEFLSRVDRGGVGHAWPKAKTEPPPDSGS